MQADNYTDNPDFSDDPGRNLYFNYDFLVNLGEAKWYYSYNIHNYTYLYHAVSVGSNSKDWLCFVGRVGNYWQSGVCGTPSPHVPFFGQEWMAFTENYSQNGWGNIGSDWVFYTKTITWVSDIPDGDY